MNSIETTTVNDFEEEQYTSKEEEAIKALREAEGPNSWHETPTLEVEDTAQGTFDHFDPSRTPNLAD